MDRMEFSLITKTNDICSYDCHLEGLCFELSASSSKITIEKPKDNGPYHFSLEFSPFTMDNKQIPTWLIVLSRLIFPEVPVEDVWPGKVHLFDFCYNAEIEGTVDELTIIIDNSPFDCEKINLFESVPQAPSVTMIAEDSIKINGDLSSKISFEELKTNLWMSFRMLFILSMIMAIIFLLAIIFTPYRTISFIGVFILLAIDIYSLVVKWKQYKSIKKNLNDWYSRKA